MAIQVGQIVTETDRKRTVNSGSEVLNQALAQESIKLLPRQKEMITRMVDLARNDSQKLYAIVDKIPNEALAELLIAAVVSVENALVDDTSDVERRNVRAHLAKKIDAKRKDILEASKAMRHSEQKEAAGNLLIGLNSARVLIDESLHMERSANK